MTKEDFFETFGKIDESYVEAAGKPAKKKKGIMLKVCGFLAACLCVAVVALFIPKQPYVPVREDSQTTVAENGIKIPQMKVDLSSNNAYDMLAFFIYQGRCYVANEWDLNTRDIIGERLGTATGLIDEWTPKEGYVELAGSIGGDFYAVKGYDPSFMLCMNRDGGVTTFICGTGITLKYGRELYEERLHLSENYVSAEYESHSSWEYSKEEIYRLNVENNETLTNFINSLNDAEFMLCSDVPLEKNQSSIMDKEIYHLYFKMKNGTKVRLRLYEGGYVRFQGVMDVCVRVPQEDFNALINLLENK